MDKAGSLHTSVPTPPPRLYLPRNFSCSACLYGSLAEQCKGGCSPDGDAAPTPVVREAAAGDEKPPPPPRGREPSLPAVPPSPTQRRRAKSLPTPGDRSLRPALQQSPSRRKTVRFADSLGLELTSVRHFCEADLPQVPLPAPLPPQPRSADLFKTRKPPVLGDLEPVLFGPPPLLLEPLFPPQPGASPGFAERVRQHKVRLEWVRAEPAGLRGAVRVLNLAYEKAVSVRYTLNRWASCAEVPAAYQPAGPADGLTDRFTFVLPLPVAAPGAEAALEFAVRYRVAGAEYWDNNEGKNYRLRGGQRVPPAAGPPQDPDSTAWIHFI
ncbi:protein phosphatase 1 regulatory subunit 3E-like [Phalacrocorax aristotelis]|uniref:protein phosphatase 1 regulatory subunit 3E-like n=1 Tax=Phalacrocorax aristotelis TaxID=126867 RepID=UPI003F4C088C